MKNHLLPTAIFILLLLLGSVGCSAAQASSQIAYVTVTPSVNEAAEALSSNPPPPAGEARGVVSEGTAIAAVASSNLQPDNAVAIPVGDFLTPLPTVDYLATSIAGSTATVARAIEINTLDYQTGGGEGEQGGGGDNPPPTATPTYQPTGTPAHLPTGTPAPTSTPVPTGPGAVVRIQNAQFTNCADSRTTDLTISGATDLQGFAFKLRFDPNIVQVVDADPAQDGTQISLGSAFSGGQNFIAVNKVDQNSGLIDFAAVMIGNQSVNGEAVLAQIEWSPRQSGSSALTLENVELAGAEGNSIQSQIHNGLAEVPPACQ